MSNQSVAEIRKTENRVEDPGEDRFQQTNDRLREGQRDISGTRFYKLAAVSGIEKLGSGATSRKINTRKSGNENSDREHTGFSRESYGRPSGDTPSRRRGSELVNSARSFVERSPNDEWRLNFPGTQEEFCSVIGERTIPGGTVAGLLEEAIEFNDQSLEISESVHKTWQFTRRLKGYSALEGLTANQAVSWLDENLPAVGGWERLPESNLYGVGDSPREAFIHCWPRVEKGAHWAPRPQVAIPLASEYRLKSKLWSSPDDATYRRLVSECFWYGKILESCGFSDFILGCRTAGELLDVGYVKASQLLRRAQEDGILKVLEKGHLRNGASGIATKYRFKFEAVKIEFLPAAPVPAA